MKATIVHFNSIKAINNFLGVCSITTPFTVLSFNLKICIYKISLYDVRNVLGTSKSNTRTKRSDLPEKIKRKTCTVHAYACVCVNTHIFFCFPKTKMK